MTQKTLSWLAALLLVLSKLLCSCDNHKVDMMALISERDSLRLQYEIQQRQLEGIQRAVSVMNETVDSIAKAEGMIFINLDGVEVTRQGALSNLDKFEDLVHRQDQRIKELEKELSNNVFNTEAQNLIKYLNSQIELKDRQIQELRNELENKNTSIAQLRRQVENQYVQINSQSQTIQTLEKSMQQKDKALSAQDQYINTGYVMLGTQEDLKRRGILDKKGRLQSESMLNKAVFAKVDIRKWTEVSFSAKKPKILTNMPATSYKITTNGKGEYLLQVVNPTDFWKLTNYLIIQTN